MNEIIETVIIPIMLEQILARIDARLEAVGLAESAAAKKAGLSDSAIRNMRRAVKAGKKQGASIKTLEALAPVLKTTPAWLLTGEAKENEAAWQIYLMIAHLEDEDLDYVRQAIEAVLGVLKKPGKAA
jgi:transcriptional regulator with XRE-family HTH domain